MPVKIRPIREKNIGNILAKLPDAKERNKTLKDLAKTTNVPKLTDK